jgi:hypothetical protein
MLVKHQIYKNDEKNKEYKKYKPYRFETIEDKLKSLDISFEEKPIPGMTSHQIFLRDPAGNRVELNFDGD